MNEFFTGPVWQAITGMTTLLAALIPLMTYIWRRYYLQQQTHQTIQDTPAFAPGAQSAWGDNAQSGCMRSILSSALNFAVFMARGVIGTGLFMSLALSSDDIRKEYMDQMSKVFSNYRYALFNCGISIFGLLILGILFFISMIIGMKWGYQIGAYFTALWYTGAILSTSILFMILYSEPYLYLTQIIADFVSLVVVCGVIYLTGLAMAQTATAPASLAPETVDE